MLRETQADVENSMLSTVFGPRRADVIEARRKLHDEELYKLYSPNTVRMVK
jgi:hypothetical protein